MKKQHKNRSYTLTSEAVSKLEEIEKAADCESKSEAVRLCIETTHDSLFATQDHVANVDDQILDLVQKIYAFVRYQHIANIKQHQGTVKELSLEGSKYLKNSMAELKSYLLNFKHTDSNNEQEL